MLADEPVSALDPTLADATLQQLVAQSESTGATFVASLHAVDLALRWFPRIVGMRSGQVVFDEPVANVTEPMLAALYASEGGLPMQAPGLPLDIAPRTFTAVSANSVERPDCL